MTDMTEQGLAKFIAAAAEKSDAAHWPEAVAAALLDREGIDLVQGIINRKNGQLSDRVPWPG